VAIHIQPLRGWSMSITFSTGFTCGYSYSTPSGLEHVHYLFHRFHLWLFIFNPFGVDACPLPFPQVSPVAYRLQPLRGWCMSITFSTGFTCGYSYSTPLGLVHVHYLFHRFHLFRQKFRSAKLLPERLFTPPILRLLGKATKRCLCLIPYIFNKTVEVK